MPARGAGKAVNLLVGLVAPVESVCGLSRAANIAPGPYGLPYYAIKKAVPGGIVLAVMFN